MACPKCISIASYLSQSFIAVKNFKSIVKPLYSGEHRDQGKVFAIRRFPLGSDRDFSRTRSGEKVVSSQISVLNDTARGKLT